MQYRLVKEKQRYMLVLIRLGLGLGVRGGSNLQYIL